MGASRVRRKAVALVAALALALPVGGCGSDERELAPGESTRVLDDPDVTRLAQDPNLTVRLPVGELGLGWSDDADLLGSVTDEEDRSVSASDGTLVAVAWDLDTIETGVAGVPGFALVGSGTHELVLVSGDERTVIAPESDRALTGAAVAVVSDLSAVALEVTFDGVTQVVGPAAEDRQVPLQAESLYSGVPMAEADLDCRPDAFCRADAAWLPWVAEQGWAPEGQAWPVIRVEARADNPSAQADLTATLDDAEPVATEDLGADDGVQQLLVFRAAAPATATLTMAVVAGEASYGGGAELSPSLG